MYNEEIENLISEYDERTNPSAEHLAWYEEMAMDNLPPEEDYASNEPQEENYISSLVASEPKTEDNTESVETGPSTLSISSILEDKVAEKQESNKAVEQDSLADAELVKEHKNKACLVFNAGKNYGKNIFQGESTDYNQYGIFYSVNVGTRKEPVYEDCLLLDGYLTSIKYYVDELGLIADYYEIGYYNNVSGQELILGGKDKGSLKEISKELENLSDYTLGRNDISALLSAFKNRSIQLGLFKKEYYYSTKGYFFYTGNLKLNNNYLEDNYGSLDTVELHKLFLDRLLLDKDSLKNYLSALKDTYGNDCFSEIAKVMLVMPFYYAFKQIGYQEPIKYLELYGSAKAGKTTNINNLLSFYSPVDYRYSKVGTYAGLRNEFNDSITLPLLNDEAMVILGDRRIQELLKDSRYNIDIKGSADNDRQGKNKYYKAFKHYIFTTNKTNAVFDGLSRGLLTYRFNVTITDEQKRMFNSKFKHNLDFSVIGYIFSKYMEQYFKDNTPESVFSYEANEFINLILYKIEDYLEEEFGEEYNNCLSFLTDVNPYEDINDELDYNYIEVCADKLQSDMVYHNRHLKEGESHNLIGLRLSNPEYKIFRLSPENDYFVASQKKLEKLLMKKANGNVVSLEQLLEFRELPKVVKISNLNEIETTAGEVFYYTGDRSTFQSNLSISSNSYIISATIIDEIFNIV